MACYNRYELNLYLNFLSLKTQRFVSESKKQLACALAIFNYFSTVFINILTILFFNFSPFNYYLFYHKGGEKE